MGVGAQAFTGSGIGKIRLLPILLKKVQSPFYTHVHAWGPRIRVHSVMLSCVFGSRCFCCCQMEVVCLLYMSFDDGRMPDCSACGLGLIAAQMAALVLSERRALVLSERRE